MANRLTFHLRRPRKWSTRIQIGIRRIHLYAGLLMFPWVILYGFTALLFNHSTWFQDRNTTIEHFQLSPEQIALLPTAQQQVQSAFDGMAAKLEDSGIQQPNIKLESTTPPELQGMFIALVDQPKEFVAVIMDPESGTGFVRKINRPKKKRSLNLGVEQANLEALLGAPMRLEIQSPELDWYQAAQRILPQLGVDARTAQLQQVPCVEFSIVVGEKAVPMRCAPSLTAPVDSKAGAVITENSEKPATRTGSSGSFGDLIAVELNQRDLSWRSYLLSLHLAHGYPFEKTIRWFWAIAVDLMFASMIFWGFSGLIMWWQIKRTRRIGWILILLSAFMAVALAYGMHLDFANGAPL